MWDPGDEFGAVAVNITSHLFALISSANQDFITGIINLDDSDNEAESISQTELDSHANMPVVGSNACVIANTGKQVEVHPFTPDYQSMSVKMVDAVVQYVDPYTGESYIFVLCNALHVPAMANNLILPFMVREAGVTVREVPKIQCDSPTEEDHSISFLESGFRVPLSLWGL